MHISTMHDLFDFGSVYFVFLKNKSIVYPSYSEGIIAKMFDTPLLEK